MDMELRLQGIDMAEAMHQYVARRIRFALSRLSGHVGRVTIRITDVNGPRGGTDKSCRISAEVLPTGSVVVEAAHTDLFTAIDTVVERFRRAFAREVERRRDRRQSRDTIRRENLLNWPPHALTHG